jgi:hypothetical protein
LRLGQDEQSLVLSTLGSINNEPISLFAFASACHGTMEAVLRSGAAKLKLELDSIDCAW